MAAASSSSSSSDQDAPMVYTNDGKEVLNLPFGYHFCPDHQEVMHYLKKKILCRKLPANIIPTIDLYTYNPDEIPLGEFKYGLEGEWYFFTQRPKGDLVVKDGYWQPTSDVEIEHGGEAIGFKQVLTFYSGISPNGKQSNWLIHEFRLNSSAFEPKELDDDTKTKIQDFVICKVIDKSIESSQDFHDIGDYGKLN